MFLGAKIPPKNKTFSDFEVYYRQKPDERKKDMRKSIKKLFIGIAVVIGIWGVLALIEFSVNYTELYSEEFSSGAFFKGCKRDFGNPVFGTYYILVDNNDIIRNALTA